jgi:MoaA/NifB/PqqE/SkfB family radical SAM enzyme
VDQVQVNLSRPERRGTWHPSVDFVFRDADGAVSLPFCWDCNQRCRYCAVRQEGTVHPRWTDAQLLAAARSARSAGLDKAFLVGGEPTAREGLPQFVSSLRNLGFLRIGIGTNALRLADGRLLQELVDAGATAFSVSLDSADPVLQNQLTRNPGNAERVHQALAQLIPIGSVDLCLFGVICSQTAAGMVRLVEHVDALRTRGKARVGLAFAGLKPVGAAATDPTLLIRHRDVLPHWEDAHRRARELGLPVLDMNLPACIFPDPEGRRWERFLDDAIWDCCTGRLFMDPAIGKTHTYLPTCADCLERQRCPGVFSGYLAVHGPREFKAVRSRGDHRRARR